jgi:hypothetical protein
MPWALVLLLATGCNNNDSDLTVTPEEMQTIQQVHKVQQRQPGTIDEIHYLVWEGTTVADLGNNPVRVVRVKFRFGTSTETSDILYRFLGDGRIMNRLNGSGDHWQPEAQVWVRGRP